MAVLKSFYRSHLILLGSSPKMLAKTQGKCVKFQNFIVAYTKIWSYQFLLLKWSNSCIFFCRNNSLNSSINTLLCIFLCVIRFLLFLLIPLTQSLFNGSNIFHKIVYQVLNGCFSSPLIHGILKSLILFKDLFCCDFGYLIIKTWSESGPLGTSYTRFGYH